MRLRLMKADNRVFSNGSLISGETESCANVTFTRGDWELVMSEVTYLAGAMSGPQHPQTLPTENNMIYHDVGLATPELLRTYW